MQWEQVGNEDVSTPGRDHVPVEERGQRAPESGSVLQGFDPEEEGEDKQKDCNCFVVIAASY